MGWIQAQKGWIQARRGCIQVKRGSIHMLLVALLEKESYKTIQATFFR
jgi:hypothetical protein